MKTKILQKVLSIFLCIVLVMACLPGTVFQVKAATNVYGGLGVKETDPSTVNNWKDYIGRLDTSLAGNVWTDKSVFESVEDYYNATDEQERFNIALDNPRNFMLALSAMASSKTIVGYSNLPIDAVFVLDVSGSMDSSSRDERMVSAANKAIGDLLALNNYNRVSVVLYSDSETILLPLDRYTTTSSTLVGNQSIPLYIRLNYNDRVVASDGLRNSKGNRPNGYREVVGGTYIQSGIYAGMEQLTDPQLDTVITEGFQAGTSRTPIMVLMSDGAPTYASTSYNNVGNSNFGNGYANSTTADIAFATQLTASYAREKILQKYGDEVEPLFYTLGLGVGGDSIALSVMDPQNPNANSKVNSYWQEFNALDEGDRMELDNHWNRYVTKLNDGVNDNNDTMPLSKDYVDEYFPATSSNDLSVAFQSIVDAIILQTMYYPTLVEGTDVHHSGYLEFHDYIGPNMEVKAVEGVQMGDTLYTGERLARLIATGMGTIDNPTDAGNELVRSVVTRLGIKDKAGKTAVEQARELIDNAWRAGQLAYTMDYDGNITWNNQICWYADADGNYLGFWDGEGVDADMVGVAAYTVRSYGFLGTVEDGHRETDMLYATFQVRSALDANGDVLEDIVYCRIPASLIPISTYNITLDSNSPETATEITMTVNGATAPLRFLFEVGLRKEIDLLDMEGTAVEELKRDEDGNFIFYTNQWDATGVSEGKTPDKLHNAYVTFKPSEENERYYFHEDMPIYVRNGNNNYVRYTGEGKPAAGDGNTYYRAYAIYTARTNGGRATYTVDWQPIPDQALAADSVAKSAGSGWVIKRGTLYLYEARSAVNKSANDTETLAYVEYPNVHINTIHGYHLDDILGNNGLLTIDAPEGIKLTKQADNTIIDNGQTYTFTVRRTSGSHQNATIYLVTETDGVRSAWQPITFTDTYTVELGIGDSAYLAGLPIGNTYEITEQINGEYEVSSITVDKGAVNDANVTVREDHIVAVEFTNTAIYTGDISISKQVVSTYNDHESENFKFNFDVTVTGADENENYPTMLVRADGTETQGSNVTTNAAGTANFQISLGHGQSLIIENLPDGASVTAVETQKPGFTSNMTNNTGTAQVAVGEIKQIAFVNTYAAESVSPHGVVDVYVKKILDGRDWTSGDSFTFVLDKHNADNSHTPIETISVDYADADKIADFQSNINEIYTTPGIYSYRISEKTEALPGIAYDTAICYFDIVVKDDGEGKLYIDDVVGRQDVTVIHDSQNDTWDVTADFTNTYNANGAIQASLSVTKTVNDNNANTGIGKSGFIFELYDADEHFNISATPRATVTTNAQGVAAFHDFLFTTEGIHYFVLKEKSGSITNMDYSAEYYNCTMNVTSDPLTSGLIANATVVNSSGQTVYQASAAYDPSTNQIPTLQYNAPFINTYNVQPVKAEISGTKQLSGRDIVDNEFTFELYEASYNGAQMVTGNYITETKNTGNTFSFKDISKLTFNATGYHYFAIKEKAGRSDIGVTYDDKTIYVAIHVVADLNNGKLVINSINYVNADVENVPALFTNKYSAAAVDLTIEADKELTGRTLAANMFQFGIYEAADESYSVSGAPLQTATNNAKGEIAFNLHYSAKGTHYYVIKERIPTNLDADGRLNGVKYDERSYRVKVEVKDDLSGNLYTDVTYVDGAAEFVNDYTPSQTTVTLSGKKTLSGQSQTEDTFSFALHETDARFGLLADAQPKITTNKSAGNGDFTFTFDEITYTKIGGYRYIIIEQNTGNTHVQYDTTVYYVLVEVTDNGNGKLVSHVSVGTAVNALGDITEPVGQMEFFNIFNHTPANLTIKGTKILKDQNWNAASTDQIFTFELYEANREFNVADGATPLTATNNPAATGNEGYFEFEEITFAEQGIYYYVAKEKMPDGISASSLRDEATGITYDPTELHITVNVDIDSQDTNRLKATYTVNNAENAVKFTNAYSVKDEQFIDITGTKSYTNFWTQQPEQMESFKFKLAGEGKELFSENDEQGNFKFQLYYTEADVGNEYTYTISEVKGDKNYITYDTNTFEVKVKVEDDGKGGVKLTKTIVDNTEIKFQNYYTEVVPVSVEIGGTKILKGRELAENEFKFLIYSTDETYKIDEKAIAKESKNTANGSFAFEKFTFNQSGTYYFVVIEDLATTAENVTNDTAIYHLAIEIKVNAEGKLYESGRTIKKAGSDDEVQAISFTNVYNKPVVDDPKPEKPKSPHTADNFSLNLWLTLLFVSGGGILTTAIYSRKKKKEEN